MRTSMVLTFSVLAVNGYYTVVALKKSSEMVYKQLKELIEIKNNKKGVLNMADHSNNYCCNINLKEIEDALKELSQENKTIKEIEVTNNGTIKRIMFADGTYHSTIIRKEI